MARLLGLVAPLIAQPVARGALSTLYTATAPELTGALALGSCGCGASLRSPLKPFDSMVCSCLVCLDCLAALHLQVEDELYLHVLSVRCRMQQAPMLCYEAVPSKNPLLAGHGGGYYGPNALNMGNTAKREPGNKYAKDPANCARAWDLTLQILKAKGELTS